MRCRSLAIAPVVLALTLAAGADAQTRGGLSRPPDALARARALDQQGARAYESGRYNDAIRYFTEAHRLGGPPFELWNIARCYLKLDEPEQAAAHLEAYLRTPALTLEERQEATDQLEALRKRPSTLTVASSPAGAAVRIDGKAAEGGKTPLTVVVAPGSHEVVVALPQGAVRRTVEARYGRAIIVDASQPSGSSGAPEPEPTLPREERIVARALLGVTLPRFGGVAGSAGPAASVSATYTVAARRSVAWSVGGLALVASDSWKNTVGAPSFTDACGALGSPNGGVEVGLYGIGAASWELARRLRAIGTVGVGGVGYLAGDVGGDVFLPSCTTSPGVRPAAFLGAAIEISVSERVLLSAVPIALVLHPAFAGTRAAPVDATGLWTRAIFGVGVGVLF